MSRILEFTRTVATEAVTEPAATELTITLLTVGVVAFAAGVFVRRGVWLPVALRASGIALVLAALAVQVHAAGPMTRWDQPVTAWLVDHRTPGLDTAAVVVTDLGSPVATIALALLVAALLAWRARSLRPAVILIGTVGAAAATSTVLKVLIARERPPAALRLVTETDYSFPSGHVTGTAALLGITAVVLTVGRSRSVRAAAAVIVVAAVSVVALTRLYLGVHWLTDVIAGALLAATFVTIGAAVSQTATGRRSEVWRHSDSETWRLAGSGTGTASSSARV